jgi:dimethylargininase
MAAPATMDGGDVLRWRSHLFVGLSSRTNWEGFETLRRLASDEGLETTAVEVAGGLHLKSTCSLADESTLVYLQGAVSPRSFERLGLTCLPTREPHGANLLALGTLVLASSAAPATAAMLEKRGIDVQQLDVSEFHKGDGALTCLSIRIPSTGRWAT